MNTEMLNVKMFAEPKKPGEAISLNFVGPISHHDNKLYILTIVDNL